MTNGKTTATLTHWGPFLIEADGKTVNKVLDHPSDPDSSVIGQGLKSATECRVARPSIRKSWLENGPGSNPHLRGKEPFIEVEWEEAFALVGAELARVRDDYGHTSVFGGSYGWGSAGLFHMAGQQNRRFMRLFGGFTDRDLTYSSAAASAIVPYIFGIPWYPACGQQTSWSVIAKHTELFVSFGSLRLNNAQVHYGGQGPHHTRSWIEQATANGTEFVNIGPVRDDESNARWLPIRPSTDVALMAGLAHTVMVNGGANEGFLSTHCEGWPQLQAYLLGATDGVAKDAAWAADITGIDEAAIVALATEMMAKRTLINLSFSIQRTDHGEQPYWMATALAAVLGEIGLPGGGVAFPFGSHGRTGGGQPPKRIPRLPMPPKPDDIQVISVAQVVDMLENPGGAYQFNGVDSVYPDIRLVYWAGGNVFHHHQDLTRLTKAWQKPDTIVVHEPFWTPMAKWADVVLPATTPMERNDIGDAETMLIAMGKAIERQGDALDDYEIYAGLAAQLGFGEAFTEGRSSDEWIEQLYETYREQNDFAPSFAEFWDAGMVTHADMAPMGANDHVFLGDFRSDPVAKPLPTPSGRIELYSETIAGYGYDECPPHPTWLEPYERLGTPAAERFPLHLVSNQPKTRLHSQFDHSDLSRDSKIQGREPARMHPTDAADRGISDGDLIRLYNDRGACLAGVQVSEAVAPGIVQLSTGAWYDPDENGMCKHGNPNVLTRDKGTSQLAQGTSAHTCIVQVERFVGEVPPITAFDPPPFVERS